MDWIRRLLIYLGDRDIELIYWFNFLVYDNCVVDRDLNGKDLIKDVMDLENFIFLLLLEEYF